jgi:hypothetical protein
MSTLVAQTISNGTVSTSSANVIQGSAKAWAIFSGSAGTISGSYNISSITRNAAGQYTFAFTTAMPNSNYAMTASVPGAGLSMWINTKSTTTTQIYSKNYANGFEDGTNSFQCIAIYA